jgi:hypothetical protein
MLDKVLKRQQDLFKKADYNSIPFKTLVGLIGKKVKNKFK